MLKRHNVSGVLSVGALVLATFCGVVTVSAHLPVTAYAARVSSLLYAPTAALEARRQMIKDEMPAVAAIPVAQTFDEDDYSSGFWAQEPSDSELVPPAASAPAEPVQPEGTVPILSAHYAQGTGRVYIPCGKATIKNCTSLPYDEVAAEVGQALPFTVNSGDGEPQILIMHTHTTETFQLTPEAWCDPAFTARSTDAEVNMVAVGNVMQAELESAGIHTLHDTKVHDYPSYNGSYARSKATVQAYLKQYPSIKVVLDVHRDAIQKPDGTRVKPIAQIDNVQCAQIMIICGADKGGNLPNFKQNLRLAAKWQAAIAESYEGLARPVLFDYRYYNQDLTAGSLLIEVGGHANTLDEAKAAGVYAARALAKALLP